MALGQPHWQYHLEILVSIAAFLAVLKPLLKFTDKIEQQTQLLTRWRLLDSGLRNLMLSISQYRKYDDEMRNRFFTLMETKATIVQKEPPQTTNERLEEKMPRPKSIKSYLRIVSMSRRSRL